MNKFIFSTIGELVNVICLIIIICILIFMINNNKIEINSLRSQLNTIQLQTVTTDNTTWSDTIRQIEVK